MSPKVINIDGEMLHHLRIANDIVLTTDNLCEARGIDLIINFNKTKMVINLVPRQSINMEANDFQTTENYIPGT